MIAAHGGSTVVSDLSAAGGLARSAGPGLTIEEYGNPGASSRGVASPGAQTASVLGGATSTTSTDLVALGCLAGVFPPRSGCARRSGSGRCSTSARARWGD